MTELEKIRYTKDFIDKMANGVNPLDGSPIPENDLLNHVRISRCLFYVSDILRQVIENDGTEKKKRQSQASFFAHAGAKAKIYLLGLPSFGERAL